MNQEQVSAADVGGAYIGRMGGFAELAALEGRYKVECRGPDGELKWGDTIENLVVNVGKNLCLDTLLSGSSYTAACYLGLADANVASATATDTMASKTTWKEAGTANAPTYTSPRKTITFSSASAGSKSSTGTYTFAITGSGTVGGCFIVLGTGAVSTIDDTNGVLFSVGAFSGGSKTVANLDSLTVTYTASM